MSEGVGKGQGICLHFEKKSGMEKERVYLKGIEKQKVCLKGKKKDKLCVFSENLCLYVQYIRRRRKGCV